MKQVVLTVLVAFPLLQPGCSGTSTTGPDKSQGHLEEVLVGNWAPADESPKTPFPAFIESMSCKDGVCTLIVENRIPNLFKGKYEVVGNVLVVTVDGTPPEEKYAIRIEDYNQSELTVKLAAAEKPQRLKRVP